jgi:hypothetical protein
MLQIRVNVMNKQLIILRQALKLKIVTRKIIDFRY